MISFILEYRSCIYIMDGVFRNSYWSVEKFFLNLKNYLRTTFNLNDSYCPYIIDLMIFDAKVRK